MVNVILHDVPDSDLLDHLVIFETNEKKVILHTCFSVYSG